MAENGIVLKAKEVAAIEQGDYPGQYYNYKIKTDVTSEIVDAYGHVSTFDFYHFIKFEEFPVQYKQKKVKNQKLFVYITAVLDEFPDNGWLFISISGNKLPPRTNIDGLSYKKDIEWAKELRKGNKISGDPISENFKGWLEATISQDCIINGSCYAYQIIFSAAATTGRYGVLLYTEGIGSKTPPYVYTEFQDANVSIKVKNDQVFVNDRKDSPLEWQIETDAIGGASAFKVLEGSVMEWKDNATNVTKTVSIEEGSLFCTIPAGTLPEKGSAQYRFILKLDNGQTVSSEWGTLTTTDSEATANVISPSGIYVDGTIEQKFMWKHETETGSPQLKAELQYSDDGGENWVTFMAVEGEEQSATIPGNTLPAGAIQWRVRTYNTDETASQWSNSSSVIVMASPEKPVITPIQGSPRPVVQWQAKGQEAYQIKAGQYDSGQVFGTDRRYKIPVFLPDGTADIQVRVQNKFGLWSEWGVVYAEIANKAPGEITLTAGTDSEKAVLTWSKLPGNIVYYVHRDGVPIAKTVDTAYTDQMTVGNHSYTVLGVAENDNYAVSNSVYHETTVRGALIASMNGKEWVKMKCRRGGRPTHRRSITPVVAYHHYAGRTLPVADISPYKTVGDTFSFTVLDKETRKALEMLAGKLVIYKDEQGVVVGVLDRISVDVRRKSDFDFDITQTEWSEEIEYSV